MKQRVAVAMLSRGNACPDDLVIEQRAQLLQWPKEALIAPHPGNVVGPAPTLHVEARVLARELPDDQGEPLRSASRLEPVPNTLLEEGLQLRQIAFPHAQCEHVLEILRASEERRFCAGTFTNDFEILRREFIHHDPAVFPISNLSYERRHGDAADLPSAETFGLVVRLHLPHELGITSLR